MLLDREFVTEDAAQIETRQSGWVDWIGGINVPANFAGRFNATWPFGRLRFDKAGLLLATRGPLRRLAKDRRASLSEIESAQEVRGAFGSRGLRVRVRDRGTWYFWTGRPQAVLAVLRDSGIAIVDGCPKLPLVYTKAWD